MPHKTNSLTALAFAPGVLKTTIPAFVASLIGMLLIPAPALAMQSNSELKDSGFKISLLSIIASGFSSVTTKLLS